MILLCGLCKQSFVTVTMLLPLVHLIMLFILRRRRFPRRADLRPPRRKRRSGRARTLRKQDQGQPGHHPLERKKQDQPRAQRLELLVGRLGFRWLRHRHQRGHHSGQPGRSGREPARIRDGVVSDRRRLGQGQRRLAMGPDALPARRRLDGRAHQGKGLQGRALDERPKRQPRQPAGQRPPELGRAPRSDFAAKVGVAKGYALLDLANPEVQAFIKETATRVRKDWGFDWLKVDFAYWDLLAKGVYDPSLTREEAYKKGMGIVREALGLRRLPAGRGHPGPQLRRRRQQPPDHRQHARLGSRSGRAHGVADYALARAETRDARRGLAATTCTTAFGSTIPT